MSRPRRARPLVVDADPEAVELASRRAERWVRLDRPGGGLDHWLRVELPRAVEALAWRRAKEARA